jgi:hypothetical protein
MSMVKLIGGQDLAEMRKDVLVVGMVHLRKEIKELSYTSMLQG